MREACLCSNLALWRSIACRFAMSPARLRDPDVISRPRASDAHGGRKSVTTYKMSRPAVRSIFEGAKLLAALVVSLWVLAGTMYTASSEKLAL